MADRQYAHDPAGNITSAFETVNDDYQCFTYDALRRLEEAWTPTTTDCTTSPTSYSDFGGPAPYWQEYAFDPLGNRDTFVDHKATGAVTTSYTQDDAEHPHAITSTSGTSTARAFTYNADGSTQTRTTPTGTTQNLTWDHEGRLNTVTDTAGESSHVYTADGQRLIRRDPAGATLYLPGEEIRYDKASNATSCTRYYTYSGSVFAVRTTPGGLQWLFNDPQGTAHTAITQGTPQIVTTRYQDPYGNPRGTTPVTWPGEHGFVNGVNDPTGLVHIGAREYDATLGSFATQDPVTDLSSSLQIHGYSYANHNPTTASDPSGLMLQDPMRGSQGSYQAEQNVLKQREEERQQKEEQDDCWAWSWACKGISEADKWIADNAVIVGTVVGIAAGAACFSIATGATFGVGAGPAAVGCGMLAGAIGGAATSYFEGGSAGEIAGSALEGAVIGGAFGFLGPLAGAVGKLGTGAAGALGSGIGKLGSALAKPMGSGLGKLGSSIVGKLAPKATAKAATPANEIGAAAETALGIPPGGKTTIPSVTRPGKTRIPDYLGSGVLADVKSVDYMYLSSQLIDFYEYAASTNRTFALIVRQDTVISSSLKSMQQLGLVRIFPWLPPLRL